ncbi:hypothetical protein [uncultured Methanoregula sp.]|uniref:hypothetical protein n=1 Tax=uncultured Methanoregula sp. TaxID=1005933 RepID=UPI003749078E
MAIVDKILGTPFERMDTRTLELEKIRLKTRRDTTIKAISKLEKEKSKLFNTAVGASPLMIKVHAHEIKRLSLEVEQQYNFFMRYTKMSVAITNLLLLKKYEKELRQSKLWTKLVHMDPDALIDVMGKINLVGKNFEGIVDLVNDTLESGLDEYKVGEEDDSVQQIVDAITSVQKGVLPIDEAQKAISFDKTLEDREG